MKSSLLAAFFVCYFFEKIVEILYTIDMKILHTAHSETLREQLYTLSKKALLAGQKLLVIVPAQASFMVEKGIMQHAHIHGFMDIEVASFEKLTERVIGFVGGRTLSRIDGPGFTMLCKLAMEQLNEDALLVLDRKDPVLHERVAALIWSLKAEGITPTGLETLAEGTEGYLGEKLSDIALIYSGVQNIAGGSLFDTQDMERFAAERFGRTEFITAQHVLIYGFDVLPNARMQTICSLAQAAQSVTMLMQAEDGETHQKQWQTVQRLERFLQQNAGIYLDIQPLAANLPQDEITALYENVYAYPYTPYREEPKQIHLAVAQNRKKEITYVAQQILSLTCEQGYSMDDIAVVAGNVTTHSTQIKEIFAGAGIPFFLENKRAVSSSPLAVFVLALLRIIAGKKWRRQDVFELLKTHFCCTAEEADALIIYGKEHGQKGFRYKIGLKNAPPELTEVQQRIFAPIVALEQAAGESTFIEKLLIYLESMEIQQHVADIAEEMQSTGFIGQARFYEQVYPAMIEVLTQAEVLSGISLEELVAVLEAGFAAKMISVVPPTTDEVLIADATHSIIGSKKVIFAIGMNDGMLPLVPDEAGVVTSGEVQVLRQTVPSFPDTMNFEDQKPYMRTFLTLGKQVFCSYNRADGQPSYLVDRIKRLFLHLPEENADETVLRSKNASLASMALELQNSLVGRSAPTSLLAMYLAQAPESLAQMVARTRHVGAPVAIGQGLAQNLYGSLRASISSIEQYYKCPYQHFIGYGIRPKEIETFEENAMQVGNYVHDLLEDFTASLSVQQKNWADVTDEQIAQLIDEAATARIPLHNKGIFEEKQFAFTEKRLREEAIMAAKAVRNQVEHTGVQIAAGEQSFGGNIFALDTAFGKLTMRGRIDRIDIAKTEDEMYLRIVDYKTGAKTFDLAEAFYGVSIQLIVYLLAAQSRLKQMQHQNITPAGGFYFTIQLPYIDVGESEDVRQAVYCMDGFLVASADAAMALDSSDGKLLSMNAQIKEDEIKDAKNILTEEMLESLFTHTKTLITKAAEDIYGGKIEIAPLSIGGQRPCRYCPYSSICMLDEETPGMRIRYAKKMDKQMLIDEEGKDGEV